MIRFPARVASLLTRRFAVAATVLTLTGAAAGGAAFAVTHTPSAATAAQTLAATTSAGAAPVAGHHAGLALGAALVRATANETGVTPKTVRQDLRSGQTLDQIAGGTAGAVETDVLTALQQRLDAAVTKGTITKEKEADLLAKAKPRLEKLMSSPLGSHHSTGTPAAG
ncbi:MAG: hypothetical protein ACREN2_00550 [Candidatus Dormibacteria bacterium]